MKKLESRAKLSGGPSPEKVLLTDLDREKVNEETWARYIVVKKKIVDLEAELVKFREERTKLREMMLAELRNYPDYKITPRERQVLAKIASNPYMTNKELASEFNITERTVKFHVSSLLNKFDVVSRQDLSQIALKDEELVQ